MPHSSSEELAAVHVNLRRAEQAPMGVGVDTAAMAEGGSVPNPDRARLLLPAMHFLRGRQDEARADLAAALSHCPDRSAGPAAPGIAASRNGWASCWSRLREDQHHSC